MLTTLFILSVVLMLTGHSAAVEPQGITVSAAISLKNAFKEIGKLYESQSKDGKVTFNLGATGDLMTQIKGGAPVDVFASAALKDMDVEQREGTLVCRNLIATMTFMHFTLSGTVPTMQYSFPPR